MTNLQKWVKPNLTEKWANTLTGFPVQLNTNGIFHDYSAMVVNATDDGMAVKADESYLAEEPTSLELPDAVVGATIFFYGPFATTLNTNNTASTVNGLAHTTFTVDEGTTVCALAELGNWITAESKPVHTGHQASADPQTVTFSDNETHKLYLAVQQGVAAFTVLYRLRIGSVVNVGEIEITVDEYASSLSRVTRTGSTELTTLDFTFAMEGLHHDKPTLTITGTGAGDSVVLSWAVIKYFADIEAL